MPTNKQSTDLWYENPIYKRYWKHYRYCMGYMRRHKSAYWKAKSKADEYENRALLHYLNYFQTINQSGIPGFPRTQYQQNQQKSRRRQTTNVQRDFEQDNSGEESFEMEITEDMLDFLEKSDQHRKELKAKREAEMHQEMQDDQNDLCTAPSEQKGAKRTAEMKMLYGKHTAMIHGMETAMQLTFNRNCDYSQPKYWPNIPLRL